MKHWQVFSRGVAPTCLFNVPNGTEVDELMQLQELEKHGEIEDIRSGENFSVVKLGNNKFIFLDDNKLQPFESSEPIIEIVCGNSAFCLLSKFGTMYVGVDANIQRIELSEAVTQVVIPTEMFYFLTASGLLFTCRPNDKPQQINVQLKSLTDAVVKLYGANQFYSPFLRTKENQIYTTKSARNTLFEYPTQSRQKYGPFFYHLKFFEDNPLLELYIGGMFCIASLKDGRWVIFGSPNMMFKNQYYDVIEFKFPKSDLVQVACNWYSAVFLTTDNKLYGIGKNEFGEIGPMSWKPTNPELTDIGIYNSSITDGFGKIDKVIGTGGQIHFFVSSHGNWRLKAWSTINLHQFTDLLLVSK